MLTDDQYARIQSHLKAARESLCLARHFAQNDRPLAQTINCVVMNADSLLGIINQERRLATVMSLPTPVA